MTTLIEAAPNIIANTSWLYLMVFIWGIASGLINMSNHGVGVGILDTVFTWCLFFGLLLSFILVSHYNNEWFFLLGIVVLNAPLYMVVALFFPQYKPHLLKMFKYPMTWMFKK